MALLKVTCREYATREDLERLFSYLIQNEKNPVVLSNLPIARIRGVHVQELAAQWCYAHKVYQPDLSRTLCYHYVLAFDLFSDIEYEALKHHYSRIASELSCLNILSGMYYFQSYHQNRGGIPMHLHIIVDSLYHNIGTSTFIRFDELKEELGETLAAYGIALAGYSYERGGKIYKGNYSPRELYTF